MIVIGIDPGKNGGIAFIDTDLAMRDGTTAVKMPATEADVWEVLRQYGGDDFAVVEKVASSPQMGVTSAFTFGKGYGVLLGCLTAAGIPFEEVSPQKWQKAMNCLTHGDKNVTKRKAQQMFPWLKVTHATADALLIAYYGAKQQVAASAK